MNIIVLIISYCVETKKASFLSHSWVPFHDVGLFAEDQDKGLPSKIAFQGSFQLVLFLIIFNTLEHVETKEFHFFIIYGFCFIKETHREDWDQEFLSDISIRDNVLFHPAICHFSHNRMCRKRTFLFFITFWFQFYKGGHCRGLKSFPPSKWHFEAFKNGILRRLGTF